MSNHKLEGDKRNSHDMTEEERGLRGAYTRERLHHNNLQITQKYNKRKLNKQIDFLLLFICKTMYR